ncbi:MAG: biopolymer transporter ExbD [Gemmatimonadales bacterium]|jgi:biopolymer transport protein TolR|nr:MAG: biopolymer transporter ExbD [Gemmatimonadales bacterium]
MSMSAGGGNPGEVSSEINVTPMIDVLLVLLIIFMITQPLNRMAMDVQIPPPDTPNTSQQPSFQIVLELLDDGTYAINTQPYPKEQLDAQLHAIYDARPAKLMFIKAGPNRIYQDVVEAMDIARGAGVQVIGFTPRLAGE